MSDEKIKMTQKEFDDIYDIEKETQQEPEPSAEEQRIAEFDIAIGATDEPKEESE